MDFNVKNCSVIDLFCGVGGLTRGFVDEQYNVIAGIDNDESCKYAYEKNNNSIFISEDIQNITTDFLEKLYPKNTIKILVGCAPCQPFSKYTYTIGKDLAKSKDLKWRLLEKFGQLIEEFQPEIVSMENVPQLRNYPVFKNFVKILIKNKYNISNINKNIFCPDYGIPQKRKRLVLLASKLGPIDIIAPTHTKENYETVRSTIGNLPEIEDGETHPMDRLHRANKLSPLNKTRIMSLKEGGSWREWEDSLKLECHKKLTGSTFNDVYGRMVWDEPAPTMTTHCVGIGNGRFGHPQQNRAISLREASLLQTFPIDYDFVGNNVFTVTNVSRHIGNAVPVRLGQVIAKSISIHLNNLNSRKNGKKII